jgi:hypothetical protein
VQHPADWQCVAREKWRRQSHTPCSFPSFARTLPHLGSRRIGRLDALSLSARQRLTLGRINFALRNCPFERDGAEVGEDRATAELEIMIETLLYMNGIVRIL